MQSKKGVRETDFALCRTRQQVRYNCASGGSTVITVRIPLDDATLEAVPTRAGGGGRRPQGHLFLNPSRLYGESLYGAADASAGWRYMAP
jgi:hypothetical protein